MFTETSRLISPIFFLFACHHLPLGFTLQIEHRFQTQEGMDILPRETEMVTVPAILQSALIMGYQKAYAYNIYGEPPAISIKLYYTKEPTMNNGLPISTPPAFCAQNVWIEPNFLQAPQSRQHSPVFQPEVHVEDPWHDDDGGDPWRKQFDLQELKRGTAQIQDPHNWPLDSPEDLYAQHNRLSEEACKHVYQQLQNNKVAQRVLIPSWHIRFHPVLGSFSQFVKHHMKDLLLSHEGEHLLLQRRLVSGDLQCEI